MSVNRYCVVMIQGEKNGKPRFMMDPHATFPNPDKDPKALARVRERATVIRARLRGTDPNDDEYRAMVREQVGVKLRVEPVILTGVPEEGEAGEDGRV